MTDLIMKYVDVLKGVPDFNERVGKIPGRATDVAKNAPGEFADLDFASKAKMIKSTLSSVSKVKDMAETMKNEMQSVPSDLDYIKKSLEKVKDMIESKEILELGKKCQTAKKAGLKDCYECAFEPIKEEKGGSGAGANGCCTTF
jgi:hypothetical protein